MKTLLRSSITIAFFLTYTTSVISQSRVDVGKSFANISRLNSGGTFQPGDTIEIRVTIAVKRTTSSTTIDSVQVFDQVPAKTTYIPGSMRVATNQGITYKGPFTEVADADAGRNIGGNITINLGRYATGTRGGRIRADSSRPSFFGSHSIMMACYRVRIDAAVPFGDTINVGGSIRYKMISPASGWTNQVFPVYKILIFQQNGFCPNGASVSAASDFNGTFGSGSTQNRTAGMLFGTSYIKQNISTGQPNDYNYAIVNNSSANGSTNPNSTMPESPALRRVFGYWDIGGDHTNSLNPSQGNQPSAPGTSGGYYVLVNASYNTDVAYNETLSNLCPNTYYEFSAWFRNLCPRCSCDSVGRGSGTSGFIPYPGNDSSGVRPNLSFEIDGLAYYTTGDIKYDRTTPWKKFGFTFLTRPGQTTASFAIRNNSPGGGGNDWAIDDITVAHCGPSITANYNPFVLGCNASPFEVRLTDTVRSVYNNYTYFKWQRSNVGGTVWTDMTGPGTSGTGSPTLVNGMYQYITSLPPFYATQADSGRYFRVIVATTSSSLNSINCAYNDGSSTMVRVIDCGSILTTNLLQFRAQKVEGFGLLNWATTTEDDSLQYLIEKSFDGVSFNNIATLSALYNVSNNYAYSDPEPLNSPVYYRLKALRKDGLFIYSRVAYLPLRSVFSVRPNENPFKNRFAFRTFVPEGGTVEINLLSSDGRSVFRTQQNVYAGSNEMKIEKMISPGIYILHVSYNGEIIRLRLRKF